jgi:hypothetical protein
MAMQPAPQRRALGLLGSEVRPPTTRPSILIESVDDELIGIQVFSRSSSSMSSQLSSDPPCRWYDASSGMGPRDSKHVSVRVT